MNTTAACVARVGLGFCAALLVHISQVHAQEAGVAPVLQAAVPAGSAALPVPAQPASEIARPAASPPPDSRYVVQPGDVLQISVWREPDLQTEVLVRPDGGLTFPLVGEVTAAGRTIGQLQADIAARIVDYVPEAVVTVAVKMAQGHKIYVVGQVQRPGEYITNREVDVVQALSMAGGTTAFAAVNKIKVLRRANGGQTTIPFRYADIEKGRNLEQNIVLQSGDVVVVP